MEDITLSRMTPDQLIEELRHYRYRKLLLNSIDRIARVGYFEWCHDEDKLITCSEEYANIFNLTSQEMLERESSLEKTLQGIHPDDRKNYRSACDLLAPEQSMNLEYRIIRDDGEIRHVRENTVMETDPKNGQIHVFGILQDITGLREQRSALEYREALAQQAETITEIGHFIYSEELAIYKYISPGFARIFGQTADEYKDKILTVEDDLADIHPEDRVQVQKIYDQYDLDGQPYSVDYRIFRVDDEERWVRERCITYLSRDGKIIESLGVLQDITNRKITEAKLLETHARLESTVARLEEEIREREKIQAELSFLANHDSLTGLPSLRLCMDRLERSMAAARRTGRRIYVMFIDLDDFKQINDSYGHGYGDEVLKVTAGRIRDCVRESDTAARIGGDEFLVILPEIDAADAIERIASDLISIISRKIGIGAQEFQIGASIGISSYPIDGENVEALIRQADSAMYKVKHAGKKGFSFSAVEPKRRGTGTIRGRVQ